MRGGGGGGGKCEKGDIERCGEEGEREIRKYRSHKVADSYIYNIYWRIKKGKFLWHSTPKFNQNLDQMHLLVKCCL